MSRWIFLSKGEEDDYINQFARGCGEEAVDPVKFNFEENDYPVVLRGILKKKIIKRCWKENRTFYFVDTGYFGNEACPSNPRGWKYWHRIVKNDLQHNKVIPRPSDRFSIFKKKIEPWKKGGRNILIATPDEKPMKFYGLDLDQWISDTISEIKKYTDRPVVVRQRTKQRQERMVDDTLQEALTKDVFALVTYNSVAATEAVFSGIPVFTLAPANAAAPVGCNDLSKIETPNYPSSDEVFEWACHLAYGQFHVSEMRSGKAKKMLEDLW